MKNKYITLLKNMGLFFIASFVPKTIAFFLVPLYTYCLSTEDYGTVDLLTHTVQLLIPFLTFQVQDAVLRFSMDPKFEKSEVFSNGLIITSCNNNAHHILAFLCYYILHRIIK